MGTTLYVPAGQGFGGSVSINDPVNCQGTINGVGGAINLNNGLVLSGTGKVYLGNGSLTVNDNISGMSGGSLNTSLQYVGSGGVGLFTQTGGTNNPSGVILGNNAGDSGTYILSGTAVLLGNAEVGISGTGGFIQSGQTQSGGFSLGNNAGSFGAYNLCGGLLTSFDGDVGVDGTGVFTQSGGTHNANPNEGSGCGLALLDRQRHVQSQWQRRPDFRPGTGLPGHGNIQPNRRDQLGLAYGRLRWRRYVQFKRRASRFPHCRTGIMRHSTSTAERSWPATHSPRAFPMALGGSGSGRHLRHGRLRRDAQRVPFRPRQPDQGR